MTGPHQFSTCSMCGRPFWAHAAARPDGAPVPRVPCLGLKAHFVETKRRGNPTAGAMELLEHTRECFEYAAKTGKAFCIAPCARLRTGQTTAAEYIAEVRRQTKEGA